MVDTVLGEQSLCHPNTLSAAASACRWPSSLLPSYRRNMTSVFQPAISITSLSLLPLRKTTRANVRRRLSQTLMADWTCETRAYT